MSLGLYIDGEFVNSAGREFYDVRNPANRMVVGRAPKGTIEDAKSAIDHAEDALRRQEGRQGQGEVRKALLTASGLVRERETDFARLMTLEQGKTLGESLGEIRFFAHTLEYYASLAIRGSKVNISDRTKMAIVDKEPIGVVAAIVPWNNPILLMGAKVAAALAAGNAIVVKPASTTPLTTLKSMEVFTKAGLPKGLINVVTGSGETVGEELVSNKKTQKVSFTGETATGKRIMQLASLGLKRVTLELGGSNPIIIADDADLEAAVNTTAVGRFRNAGQGCMCVKRAYVFEEIAPVFIEKLTEKSKAIRVGDGMKPETIMGPVHTETQRTKVTRQVSETVDAGGKLILGGGPPEDASTTDGFFFLPTLVLGAGRDSPLLTEECFGPALPITVVKDMREAVDAANDSIYGLGAFVWTKDIGKAKAAAYELKAGTVLINAPYGAGGWEIEVPMGGFKQSGLGREYGLEGLESYTETKTTIFGG